MCGPHYEENILVMQDYAVMEQIKILLKYKTQHLCNSKYNPLVLKI